MGFWTIQCPCFSWGYRPLLPLHLSFSHPWSPSSKSPAEAEGVSSNKETEDKAAELCHWWRHPAQRSPFGGRFCLCCYFGQRMDHWGLSRLASPADMGKQNLWGWSSSYSCVWRCRMPCCLLLESVPCCEEAQAAGLVRPYGAVRDPPPSHAIVDQVTWQTRTWQPCGCVPLKVDSLPPVTASQLTP